jgi:tetratricopeptide (TPR) repeat protein
MTGTALREWEVSRKLISHRPVLDASLGLALLHEARDLAGALSAFEDGIKNDPKNTVNYSGAVTAMALLGKTANTRVETIERYPDKKHMPASLLYELALNRAEAGDFGGATALFHDRFFGREEGGTNVREVWIEVKLEEVSEVGKRGNCAEALAEAKALGLPVTGLAFSQDGLAPILNSARTNVLLAEVYDACGHQAEAAAEFNKASKAGGSSDFVWVWAAAKRQEGYDQAKWMNRLNAEILQAEENLRHSNVRGWWMYTAGILRIAAGQKEQGQAELREALLLPEIRMSHHFARLALTEATPR